MKLEQENDKPIEKPKWEDIESALHSINRKTRSFFILSDAKGNYVQTAGARLRLIVEYKKKTFLSYKRYVLGLTPINEEKISINYSGGAIALRKNEILTINDALAVFKQFYETHQVPDIYIKREIVEK